MRCLNSLTFVLAALIMGSTWWVYSASQTVRNKTGRVKNLRVNSRFTDYYVTPDGIGSGRLTSPSSLSNALYQSARQTGIKRIWLRQGTYTNVAFTVQDTNLTLAAYPGETPNLMGGQNVAGGVAAGGVVTYTLPTFPPAIASGGVSRTTNWMVRFLCNSTGPLTWASYSTFYHTNLPTTPDIWNPPNRYRLVTTNDWTTLDTTNAELVLNSSFLQSIVGVTNVADAGTTLWVNPIFWSPPGYGSAATYFFWNLTNNWTAGQWVHDRINGTIIVNTNTAETLQVPTTTRILVVRNSKNVTIKGITFSITTANTVDGRQYCAMSDSALTLTNCQSCTLDGVKVSNVGGNGIDVLADNNSGITIKNCIVRNAGGTGILAASNGSSYEHRPTSLVISNNFVYDVGLVRHGAVGIIGGDYIVSDTVSNCPYSGIVCVKNGSLIESNRVHNAMNRMRDGAAIHIATCSNVITRFNYITDIPQNSTQGGELDLHEMAIYNENFVSGNVFSNNLVTGSHFSFQSIASFADNCIWNNNVAINDTESKGLLVNYQRQLLAHPTNNVLTNNIFYGPGGVQFQYTNIILSAWSNIVYSGASATTNLPFNTVIADPGLVSLSSPNVQFTPGGAAAVAGLVPFNLSNVGYQP